MPKALKSVIDGIVNLRFFQGHRTTVLGGAIVALNLYQAFVGLDVALYTIIQGVLIERLAHFAKAHK